MSDDRLPHSSLDDAIDRAVRDMTNVDPMAGFERRVMRRIDRPSPRRFGWLPLAAAASAVALLIVLGAVLTKRTAPGAITANPPEVATTMPVRPPAQPPTVTPATPSAIQSVGTKTPPLQPDARVVLSAAAVNEPPIHTIPALEPPDALGVADMETRPVAVGEIALSDLDIRQLNVQPLQTLDERPKE